MSKITEGLVSTIIPVFNRTDMLRQAVQSVFDQTYRPIEIILVDDGSTERTTVATLKMIESQNPSIVRVLHQANAGPGAARESGRQAARGEFIQYLDSDDWLLPEKFSTQVQALRDRPECGIAYGITHLVDTDGNIIKSPSKHTGEVHSDLFPLLLRERWWHTSTPLYRRTLSDAAGPWPRQRPEDWDLEARMGALRTGLVYCNEPVSCHRDHGGPERVTRGDGLAYLKDEAWFLPRLHACATKAGVAIGSAEMEHFSRWVFMRARHLGMAGETQLANELMALARTSAAKPDLPMKMVQLLSAAIGWRTTGRLAGWREKLLG